MLHDPRRMLILATHSELGKVAQSVSKFHFKCHEFMSGIKRSRSNRYENRGAENITTKSPYEENHSESKTHEMNIQKRV